MLEVKNLTKIYKTKGGDVTALDDVSVIFPEKGMVFLLGKSGSGKSTLLNVCGGLDSPSYGEIIVKGKSSKNFSQSDFDSYRNTFVGFIFQEYNILNEFSVEDNIALALELQGKPKNKATINNLLEQVDLKGYGKRKPNTLSGGQKQRIAIARALVKSPEIIMADEPTGALDSNTGKQVFETLKKLSKEKLVLVVSHDRDFAEQYGDRIIELKDGKIISDVSKAEEPQKTISTNVNAIGNTLCINNGADLTENDFDEIKAFLKNSKGNVLIASGEKDVKNFKDVNRITDDGTKEVFVSTNEDYIEKKSYSANDSKFIRSKLPAKHAFKLGVSGLKTKPIRLFFTILLCVVAFSLFGVSSTMMLYDRTSTLTNSLESSASDILILKKQYQVTINSYENDELSHSYTDIKDTNFTQEEFNKIKSTLNQDAIVGAKLNQSYIENLFSSASSNYYSTQLNSAFYLNENNSLRNKIYGNYPASDNEVVISSYIADCIMHFGLRDENNSKKNFDSRDKLIGEKIRFNYTEWVITGIFQTPELDAKFDSLKEGGHDYNLQTEFISVLSSNLYMTAIVTQSTLENLLSSSNVQSDVSYFDWENTLSADGSYTVFESIKALQILDTYYFKDGKTTLNNNQTLISISKLSDILSSDVFEHVKVLEQSARQDEANELQTKYDNLAPKIYSLVSGEKNDEQLEKFVPITDTDIAEYTQAIKEFITYFEGITGRSLTIHFFVDLPSGDYINSKNLSIEGFFIYPQDRWGNYCYLSADDYTSYKNACVEKYKQQNGGTYWHDEEVTKYVESKNAKYSIILIPFDHSSAQITELIQMLDTVNNDDSFITLESPITQGLIMADGLIESLSEVFLILGIVLAVFSALLLCNFISVSISHKKKDIGILRAVGARSLDVFKIFFSESLVIVLICIALSVVCSGLVCNLLNTEASAMLSGVTVFVFGPINILLLVSLAIITCLLATFFPVNSAAKKKPVESIRAY